jgi:hypothetical protein
MRIAAVVANLAQMAIILLVFLLKGVALGGWTIFALFLLLLIAFFNLLVLLFHSALAHKGPARRGPEKAAIIKRQDLRIAYVSQSCPTLMFGNRRFSLSDLSENGMRILIGRHEPLKKRIRGHVALLCGETVAVNATLLRREGDSAALVLKKPIDYAMLLKEKQALADKH